jgi:hypothetical protein
VFNHTGSATRARAVRGLSLINGVAAHYLSQETPELGDALPRLAIDWLSMRTRVNPAIVNHLRNGVERPWPD